MDDLVKALRSGEQADMDGTLVKVSRQACEEAADAIEALQAQLAEARDKALGEAAAKLDMQAAEAHAKRTSLHDFADEYERGVMSGAAASIEMSATAIRAMKGARG